MHEIKSYFFDQLGSEQLLGRAVRRIGEILEGTFTAYQIIEESAEIVGFVSYPEANTEAMSYLPIISEHLLEDHPLMKLILSRGLGSGAKTISDYVSQDVFEATPLYVKAYSHLGFRYQLSIALWDDSKHAHVLSLNRADRDFDQRERALLEELYPSFLKALKCNHLINERLNQLRTTVELTRRENEVLLWLAEGKTNAEIAVILGISPRTVAKHLENLFSKLGFENRASAIRYVMGVKRLTFSRSAIGI